MKRTGTILGVALLVVLDVVLVVLAWNHVNGGDPEVADPVTAGSEPSATDTSSGEPPDSQESQAPDEGDAPAAYEAAVVSGEVLARAAVRPCEAGGPATVEISEDGGESFTDVTTPLASVRHVALQSASEMVVVGADGDCEPAARTTDDGGESWDSAPLEAAGWHLVGEGRLFSPAGDLGDIGCAPAAVSGVTEEDAVVLCEGGLVLRTENGGSFWGAQSTLPAAVDVAFVSAADGYALVSRDDCPALVRTTTDGGSTWRDVECLEAEPPVAAAADGDAVVVVSADEVVTSVDRGQGWEVH